MMPFTNIGNGIPFDDLNRKHRRKIMDVVFDLWGIQRGSLTEERVKKALSTKSFDPDFLQQLNKNVYDIMEKDLLPEAARAMNSAGTFTANEIDNLIESTFSFDPQGDDIISYLSNRFTSDGVKVVEGKLVPVDALAGNLPVQYSKQQLKSLSDTLQYAVQNNLPDRAAIPLIRDSVTLTEYESAILRRFEQRQYEDALKELTGKNIEKRARDRASFRAQRKARKMRHTRAERIARTELARLKGQAEIKAHLQALAEGKITTALKTWDRNNFVDNWESSLMYDTKTIEVNGSFARFGTPSITTMTDFRAPGEINELCSLSYMVGYKQETRNV
jgi:hypothetical protein